MTKVGHNPAHLRRIIGDLQNRLVHLAKQRSPGPRRYHVYSGRRKLDPAPTKTGHLQMSRRGRRRCDGWPPRCLGGYNRDVVPNSALSAVECFSCEQRCPFTRWAIGITPRPKPLGEQVQRVLLGGADRTVKLVC
jgi:hypothetical protein